MATESVSLLLGEILAQEIECFRNGVDGPSGVAFRGAARIVLPTRHRIANLAVPGGNELLPAGNVPAQPLIIDAGLDRGLPSTLGTTPFVEGFLYGI
jgi:hypothetical protein